MAINGQHVIERIGFAERWLDRAKRQCEGGDVPRGLMALFLANAEMTHALHMAHDHAPARRRWFVSGIAVAAACAFALTALAPWQGGPRGPVSGAETPAIIQFSSRTGALLDLVGAVPLQVSQIADAEKIEPQKPSVRVRVAARRIPATPTRAPQSISSAPVHPYPIVNVKMAPQPAHVASRSAAPMPASEQTAAPPVPSDTELINLVLTAERTLRTQSRP